MDWVTGIQNAIDYVEEHLTEEIDYDRVAEQAACSNFYFQRIFSILCGMTLGEYIRGRRLTLAGNELKTSRRYTFRCEKGRFQTQIIFSAFRENFIERRNFNGLQDCRERGLRRCRKSRNTHRRKF